MMLGQSLCPALLCELWADKRVFNGWVLELSTTNQQFCIWISVFAITLSVSKQTTRYTLCSILTLNKMLCGPMLSECSLTPYFSAETHSGKALNKNSSVSHFICTQDDLNSLCNWTLQWNTTNGLGEHPGKFVLWATKSAIWLKFCLFWSAVRILSPAVVG